MLIRRRICGGFLAVGAVTLGSCGGAPRAADNPASVTAPPSAPTDGQASLRARPLKLGPLQPNSRCPVSSMKNFASPPGHKLPGYGYGPGPVFLSGQDAWYSGESAIIFVAPDYSGPVVVRGRQLDGPNGIPFRDQHGDGDISVAPGPAAQWRWWGDMVSGPPGCYGLQADGTTFSEVIVFSLTGGTPPPG